MGGMHAHGLIAVYGRGLALSLLVVGNSKLYLRPTIVGLILLAVFLQDSAVTQTFKTDQCGLQTKNTQKTKKYHNPEDSQMQPHSQLVCFPISHIKICIYFL